MDSVESCQMTCRPRHIGIESGRAATTGPPPGHRRGEAALIVLPVLLVLLLAAVAAARPLPDTPRPTTPAPQTPRADPPTTTALRNGGFEEIDAGSTPLHWQMFREAFHDNDPLLAHTGTGSVRSSFLFGWKQDLLCPCSPAQTFAIRGHAMREFDGEEVRIRCAFFDPAGNYIADRTGDSPLSGTMTYTPFHTSHTVPPDAAWMSVYLAGRDQQSWIRYDDVALVTEQLEPAPHAWKLTGNAQAGAGSLTLPPESAAEQDLAHALDGQGYFACAGHACTATTTVTLTERWLPRGTSESTTAVSASLSLPPGSGFSTWDLPRAAGAPSGLSAVEYRNDGPATVTLAGVSRGFARVEPSQLVTGAASPDQGLFLSAAWPQQLTSATIEIRDAAQAGIAIPAVTLHGTSAMAHWDGEGAASGAYHALFRLQAGAQTVEIRRNFTVTRDDVSTPTVPPYSRGTFTRCAWIFLHDKTSPDAPERAVQLAVQDGFNFAVIHCRPDQFPAVRTATEAHSLPFVIQSAVARSYLAAYLPRQWFSRSEYLARMRDLHAPLAACPMMQGVYVVDEPFSPRARDLAYRCNLSIVQDASLGTPFEVLPHPITPGDIALVQSPTLLVDIYPFYSTVPVGDSRALLDVIPSMNEYARTAAALGRDFWLVAQAFELQEGWITARAVPNSMHSAQLGAALLAGARGVVPFLGTSASYIEGLRGPDFEPTRKLTPYIEFNAMMERIGPLIMDLATPALDTRAPFPIAASTAATTAGANYLHVLNTDDTLTRTIRVELAPPPTTPLDDIAGQRPLPTDASGRAVIALAPGAIAVTGIGSATITGYTMDPVESPAWSTFSLPLLHQFTALGDDAQPEPVLGLQFDSIARRLAVSPETFRYIPSAPQVYALNDDGTVTRSAGPAAWLGGQTRFLDGGQVAVMSDYLGLRIFADTAMNATPITGLTGLSGGARSVLESGATLWMSMGYFGLRRLDRQPGTLGMAEAAIGESGSYSDLLGPFASGRVCVLVSDMGIDSVTPGALAETSHVRAARRRVQPHAALNGAGTLAVPRCQRGVSLFTVTPQGEAAWLRDTASEAVDATAVTWITDSLLAVADGIRHVRFYSVHAATDVLLGTWRPADADHICLRSLDARQGRMAAGLQDGRVFVVDTTPVAAAQAQPDWPQYP